MFFLLEYWMFHSFIFIHYKFHHLLIFHNAVFYFEFCGNLKKIYTVHILCCHNLKKSSLTAFF